MKIFKLFLNRPYVIGISESVAAGKPVNGEANHSPAEEAIEVSASASAPEEVVNGAALTVNGGDPEDASQFTFTPGHHPKNAG